MNATSLLSSFATAAERIRHEVLSPAAIAKATGHAVSTISRDRAEKSIMEWKASDLLLVALASPDLRAALRAICDGQEPEGGDPSRVQADLLRDVRTTADVEERIRSALLDGVLRVNEIDEILDAIAARRTSDAQLARDLRAARRTARP